MTKQINSGIALAITGITLLLSSIAFTLILTLARVSSSRYLALIELREKMEPAIRTTNLILAILGLILGVYGAIVFAISSNTGQGGKK